MRYSTFADSTLHLQPISKNLVLNGKLEKSLILWNRTSSRAYEHSTQIGNSVVAETIKDAISMSDIVWSCLADQDAVLETFELILKEDIKGKLFVECSTFTAEATNDLARKVIDSGGEFVAMPGKRLPLNIQIESAVAHYSRIISIRRTRHG
jgi:3-hydroxyisobutyrate dehydrogenase-like beta-hydroxyacid dehydrogenase